MRCASFVNHRRLAIKNTMLDTVEAEVCTSNPIHGPQMKPHATHSGVNGKKNAYQSRLSNTHWWRPMIIIYLTVRTVNIRSKIATPSTELSRNHAVVDRSKEPTAGPPSIPAARSKPMQAITAAGAHLHFCKDLKTLPRTNPVRAFNSWVGRLRCAPHNVPKNS